MIFWSSWRLEMIVSERQQRSQPTPIEPNIMIWFVSYHLGAFGTVLLLHEARCTTGWTGAINAKVRAIKSDLKIFATSAPGTHHWTLNSCFYVFHTDWVQLRSFRCSTKLGLEWANLLQLMQKFVPRSRVWTCHYEPARSTQLDPKLMFYCVL